MNQPQRVGHYHHINQGQKEVQLLLDLLRLVEHFPQNLQDLVQDSVLGESLHYYLVLQVEEVESGQRRYFNHHPDDSERFLEPSHLDEERGENHHHEYADVVHNHSHCPFVVGPLFFRVEWLY